MNLKNDRYKTPLITALESDKMDIFRVLLESKANPNLRDSENDSPLHYLSKSKEDFKVEPLRSLIDHKADLNMKNNKGDTPAHLFCESSKINAYVLEYMIESKANINIKNKVKSNIFFLLIFYILKFFKIFVLFNSNFSDFLILIYFLIKYKRYLIHRSILRVKIKNSLLKF